MNKNSETICISKKRAWVIGLIISIIYAIITSYVIAYICANTEIEINNISFSTFFLWLIPVLFVIFGTCILAFNVISIYQKK